MDQVTFNAYVESVILKKTEPDALEGHLGDVKMSAVRKEAYDDRYVGESVAESQLRIEVVYGGSSQLRTVYNSMFPLGRYIENLDEVEIEILKQKLLQYKAELGLMVEIPTSAQIPDYLRRISFWDDNQWFSFK